MDRLYRFKEGAVDVTAIHTIKVHTSLSNESSVVIQLNQHGSNNVYFNNLTPDQANTLMNDILDYREAYHAYWEEYQKKEMADFREQRKNAESDSEVLDDAGDGEMTQ